MTTQPIHPSQRRPTPRPFTTYTEVEVALDPDDLQAAGWVYVGTSDDADTPPVELSPAIERLIIERHDDEHTGPVRWCGDSLCREVTR